VHIQCAYPRIRSIIPGITADGYDSHFSVSGSVSGSGSVLAAASAEGGVHKRQGSLFQPSGEERRKECDKSQPPSSAA
jgi:hypothetical protein